MPVSSPLHQFEAQERRARWSPALAGLVIVGLLAAGWVGLLGFLTANAGYGTITDIEREFAPDIAGIELDLPNLSQVSKIFAAGGEQLAELHDGRVSEPVPIDQVPASLIFAFLAAEDADYYQHEGVDFAAIFSAFIDNLLRDTRRGGSTITQQVVKNNFIGDEPTIRRKITEAFVAVELERRYSKDQVFEYYLNSVYFGSGAYGIKAAAREFFGKELNELELAESATLAVIIRNPTLYDPRTQPEVVQQRRDNVLRQMWEKGWVSETEFRQAQNQPLDVIDHEPFAGAADHVVAEVKRQLLNNPEFAFLGDNRALRKQFIFGCPADNTNCQGGGGLRVETTIDLDMQRHANQVLADWLPLPPFAENLELCRRLFPNDSEGFLITYAQEHSCSPTGAIASVDNQTGAVLVMASGLPFEFTQFDLAIQGRRNPGSAFKPFGLVAALEGGITLNTHFDGQSPQILECPSICTEAGREWEVSNAGTSYGVIPLNQATSASVNVVYAKLSLDIGPERVADVAHRMGVESELIPVPSIVLGTSSVSPLEMASAYSNFATNGVWASSYLISRILDADGDVLYEHEPTTVEVGDPSVFAAARQPLLSVPTSAGTAPRANIGRPQGGKTGTHQDYRDAWYVGFVPQVTTAVWVGYERDQLSLRNVTINGERYSRVFGGSVPAPIWADFMEGMLENTPEEDFPVDPPGMSRFLRVPFTTVPLVVGLELEEAEEAIRAELLNPLITETVSLEPAGTIIRQDAIPGEEIPQGAEIGIWISTGPPDPVALPDLRGLSFADAQAQIEEVAADTGVEASLVWIDQPTLVSEQVGTIINTDPGPGARVSHQEVVRVYVGVEPHPLIVPESNPETDTLPDAGSSPGVDGFPGNVGPTTTTPSTLPAATP